MEVYNSLNELLQNSPESQSIFNRFPKDAQVALQEQRQDIHTHADLCRVAESFQNRG